MRIRIFLISLALLAVPASAQLSLPRTDLPPLGDVIDPLTGELLDEIDDRARSVAHQAMRLAEQRLNRIDRLIRGNRDIIELDARGAPARKGELLLVDPVYAQVEAAKALGFTVLGTERLDSLELQVVRLGAPGDLSLKAAQTLLENALPDATISADNLHFQSGAVSSAAMMAAGASAQITTPVGVIDGAPGKSVEVDAVRGFAQGAPYPSNHGSAVASLLHYAGARKIRVADVYGTDKAGGNSLAVAKAMGWLVGNGSKVINISLVGPRNALVERAIARAQSRGVAVVAAVGNDGPAAPPAFPASYDNVIAVTAVDRKNRALIEAGRALHLDYASPGADIYARDAKGNRMKLRGTSFASPLVAARLAAAMEVGGNWRTRLDKEARDLGKKGPDPVYGRGLLCETCRPRR